MNPVNGITGSATGWLRRHRPGPTALLWAGSVFLLLADVLAADLIPGPRSARHWTAASLAITAAVMFLAAAALGLRYFLRQRARQAWIRKHRPGTPYPIDEEAISREAARGISACEAFLARQKHTH